MDPMLLEISALCEAISAYRLKEPDLIVDPTIQKRYVDDSIEFEYEKIHVKDMEILFPFPNNFTMKIERLANSIFDTVVYLEMKERREYTVALSAYGPSKEGSLSLMRDFKRDISDFIENDGSNFVVEQMDKTSIMIRKNGTNEDTRVYIGSIIVNDRGLLFYLFPFSDSDSSESERTVVNTFFAQLKSTNQND